MFDETVQCFDKLDVLINNAGVFSAPQTKNENGLDIRFVVNSIAPFMLATELSPLLGISGRIVNMSSAAQVSVNINVLKGKQDLSNRDAYARSKLALIM